jgi:hypothetical protein
MFMSRWKFVLKLVNVVCSEYSKYSSRHVTIPSGTFSFTLPQTSSLPAIIISTSTFLFSLFVNKTGFYHSLFYL